MLLIYYGVLSLMFTLGSSTFSDYSNTIALNGTELADSEIEQGGFFSTGVNFARFFSFVGFGIGLPDSTPS